MSLAAGSKLAHYEIVEPLGAGGMGEVYRARDEKLGRDVAIKVLPEELAGDPDRLARFEREAKLLASVNHPSIATLHGLEHSDGIQFLVMELVEGETLADRIARGPIATNEAIPLFVQIADALEAAHGRGVIHRDLKPGNIMITPDDRVKVLDFGLAKAWLDDAAEGDASQSPTLTRGSAVGEIMGTAAYMSPEQARGKALDKRTDLWAFGVVLFEALTGKRPFRGEDVSQTLAFVLTKDVDWSALPASTPESVRRLLRRTLERDRRRRLADASDARLELEDHLSADEGLRRLAPASRPRWTVALVAAIAAASASGFIVWRSTRVDAPIARLLIASPPTAPIMLERHRENFAVTPDGSAFVFLTLSEGDEQLQLRPLADTGTIVLASGESGYITSPFVSSDGRWIGFSQGNELKKVAITGGTPIAICSIPGSSLGDPALRGASWGDDDFIVFGVSRAGTHGVDGGLFRVSANGGEPQRLTEAKDSNHVWPDVLPGSRAVLYTIRRGLDRKIAVFSMETGEEKVLINQGTVPRYVPTGHVIYSVSGQIHAAPFDAKRLELTGEAVALQQRVVETSSGAAMFALSDNGVLATISESSGIRFDSKVGWVDRAGRITHLAYQTDNFQDVALSPDGAHIAVDSIASTGEGVRDIWIYDVERGARTRLTLDGGEHPVWTPDGARVVFAVDGIGLLWRPVDGSREAEILLEDDRVWMPNSWSPDGKLLAYTSRETVESASDIWVLSLEGGPSPLVATPAREEGPMFSPNGRFLAYVSDESGVAEVYVQPYPGPGGKTAVSVGGGRAPVWSPAGDEIFYRRLGGGEMMAVDVQTAGDLDVGSPRMLFDDPYLSIDFGDPHYDVSRDGQRFLMIDRQVAEDTSPPQILVTLNWFQELERLVPAR